MKKNYPSLLRKTIVFIFLFFSFSTVSLASTFYWVGNGGRWNDYTHHWATTSGGSIFYTHVPTSTDDVIFDANSFTASGQKVRVDTGTFVCRTMNWTGVTNSPQFTTNNPFGSTLQIYGSLTIALNMSWDFMGIVSFEATSGVNTIKTWGRSFRYIYFNGAGGEWSLQDSLYTVAVNINKGTFRSNNHRILTNNEFAANAGYTSVYLGTSTITSGSTTLRTPLGVLDADSAKIYCSYDFTSDNGQAYDQVELGQMSWNTGLIANSCTFNKVTTIQGFNLAGTGNVIKNMIHKGTGTLFYSNSFKRLEIQGDIQLDGNNSIDTLILNNANKTITLTSGTTQTINVSMTTVPNNCYAGNITLRGSTSAKATISKSSGTVTCSNLYLADIKTAGGATFVANNSIVLSNVTGWTVNSPAARTLYWVGGTGNWSDANHWSLTSGGAGGQCLPIVIDNVVLDANSFTSFGQILTIDRANVECKNFTCLSVTNQPIIYNNSGAANINVYGSFALAPGLTWSYVGNVLFKGAATGNTINTAGKYITKVGINGSGSWGLLDSLSVNDFEMLAGNFYTNNKLVRCVNTFGTSYPTASSSPMGLYFGTSTIISANNIFLSGTLSFHGDSSLIKCRRLTTGIGKTFHNVIIDDPTVGVGVVETVGCSFDSVIFNETAYISENSNHFDYALFKQDGIIQGVGNVFGELECRKNLTIPDANSYGTLYLNNPGYVNSFDHSQTITNQLIAQGSCADGYIVIQCNNPASQFSFVKTSGVVNCNYLILKNANGAGGATFNAANSINIGSSGWIVGSNPPRILYWVGGSGSWSDFSHWSLTSGGAGGECYPSASDNVVFDNSSFPAGGTLSINTAYSMCKDMNWTLNNSTPSVVCTYPAQANQPGILAIFGSLNLNQNVNWNYNGEVQFAGPGRNKTINTRGHALLGDVYFEGAGSEWVLQDSIHSPYIHMLTGNLNTNSKRIRCDYFDAFGDTLMLGTSDVYCDNWNNSIDSTVAARYKFSGTVSRLYCSNFYGINQKYNLVDMRMQNMATSASYSCVFNKALFPAADADSWGSYYKEAYFEKASNLRGDASFRKVQFNNNATIYNNNVIDTLILNNPGKTLLIDTGIVQTINQAFIANSTLPAKISVKSLVAGTRATLNITMDTVCINYMNFKDIQVTGGPIFYAGLYSGNLGNNVGVNFLSCNTLMSDVWPGDANADNTVDYNDLLYIGQAYAQTGTPRASASLSWTGQLCPDWNVIFPDFVNVKHADCDGNGIVDSLDLQAVALNFGQTHSSARLMQPGGHIATAEANGPDLWLSPVLPSYAAGTWVTLPVQLGTASNTATNAYGTAFTLQYDPTYIESGSVSFSYGGSWLAPAGNIIHAEKDAYSQGEALVAMSRINHANVSGNGQIALLRFQVKPGVAGVLHLSFSDAKMVDSEGTTILLNGVAADLNIGNTATVELSSPAGNALCSGTTVNIPYTTGGTFNPANNFTVQLSDASGNFTAPVNLGSVNAVSSGSLDVVIPSATAPSRHYRIRIISSDPYVISPSSGDINVSNPPADAGAISGPVSACLYKGTSTNAAYTIDAIPDINTYTWTLPSNATIVSGQGTNTIQVSYAGAFLSGTITVGTTNSCGNGAASSLNVITVPATPVAISGPTNACSYISSATSATYSITPMPGASSYTWTVPANATIASGQGTSSIRVNYTVAFTSGNITVKSNSACGSSAIQSLAISKTIPAVPGTIDGVANVCAYVNTPATLTYSISPVADATSYTWTVPTNAVIVSGQGTTSVQIKYNYGFTSGNITVKSVSGCGSSATKTLAISSSVTLPGTVTGPSNVCSYLGTSTTATYSIVPVAGAISYQWSLPYGATIVSGGGTTSISVTFAANFQPGNMTVKSVSNCGTSTARTFALTSTPAIPGTISGPTNACQFMGYGTTATYSITPVSGAQSYYWTVPTGALLISGQGTNSIGVVYYASFVSGNIGVQNIAFCGTSSARTLVIGRAVPAIPGTITGPTNACIYMGAPTNATYSITTVAGAASYNWTVPSGATIVSGQGTTSINVSYSGSFTTGDVTVQSISACGNSAAKTLTITQAIPAVPGTITGPTNACIYMDGSTNAVYSITAVSGATSYNWSVPSGATIVSGQGTTAITVGYTAGFVSGNVSVQSVAGCGSSTAKTLAITKTIPAQPGIIVGPTNACPYVGTSTNVTYTINPVSGASSYNWVVPANVTIVSGQGTASINVNFAGAFTSGTISVQAVAGCGSSTARTLAITKTLPAQPGVITGPTNACAFMGTASNATYSITAVSGATSYNWTVPANASIVSGQGTTNINVSYSGSFVSGNVTVQSVANCGSSTARTLAISKTIPAIPAAISGPTDVCPFVGAGTNATYSITAVSGAASYNWIVPSGVTIVSGQGTTSISVSFAGNFTSGIVSVQSVSTCGNSSARTLSISNTMPATPGSISGPTDACSYLGSATNASYSITTVSGATSYNWNVPSGATIVSGQGASAISVSYSSGFTSGTISVQSVSSCGSSATSNLAIQNSFPAAPSGISGPADACSYISQGTNATYAISAVNGAASYNWSVPAGMTILAGQGTTSITVSFVTSYVPGDITVQSVAACGSSSATALTVANSLPAAPAVINGATEVCQYAGTSTNVTYSITAVSGATSYNWTVSSGATLVSGQGTTSINVSFSAGFVNGAVSVQSVASCGNSGSTQLVISNSLPVAPGPISGPTDACPAIGSGTNAVYTIDAVNGATSYNWNVPSNATIVSGQGTTSITVNYSSSFNGGSITVQSVAACGSSSAISLSVINSTPPAPASINGPSIICSTALTGVVYTVDNISGASIYNWTVPSGATIVSGQGTTTLVVDYSVSFTGGSISVSAGNFCNSSAPVSLAVSTSAVPASPAAITGPSSNVCASTGTYSISAVTNATSYTWTVPSGVTITSGQGTAGISVSFDGTFTSGNVSVSADNSCGTSAAQTLAISKIPTTPGVISGPATNACTYTVTPVVYSIAAVSGAISYTWAVPAGATLVNGQGTTSIQVTYAGGFTTGTISVVTNNTCASSTSRTLAITGAPAVPGTISGPQYNATIYSSTPATYSVATVPGATSYTWTVPAGATLVSGQGTNSITVTFAGNYNTGVISVVANNSCASSVARTTVVDGTPPPISDISGPSLNICGTTGTYSVSPVSGATSYSWTVPSGVTITSGQGTNSISVSYGGSFTSGNVTVYATNGSSNTATSILTVSKLPATPGLISGPSSNICVNVAPVTYSVAPVAGAASYTWSVPSGATLVSGQGTNAISVTYAGTYTSGTMSVVANNSCSSSTTRTLTVTASPLSLSAISGPSANVCALTGTYSVTAVAGVTSYSWTVPAGVTITSGQGTNSISVSYGGSFTNGNVTVFGTNGCSNTATKVLAISKLPPAPATISGPVNNACTYTSSPATYSVVAVAGATSYTWSVPSGATLVSGQGTNVITVTFAGTYSTGVISVVSNNSCASSAARTLTVSGIPLTPGVISGQTSNVCGGTTTSYSITPVSGATSYVWSVPTYASITSGQGTNTVTITFSPSYSSNIISVVASNGCSNSAPRTLAITAAPAIPPAISGPTANLCSTSGNTYSVVPVSGATGYTWSVVGGTITSGQGSNSIMVSYGTTVASGSVKVTANNACGSSAQKVLALTNCDAGSGSRLINAEKDNSFGAAEVFPNPTASEFFLEIESDHAAQLLIEIVDLNGRILKSHTENIGEGGTMLQEKVTEFAEGMYTLRIIDKTTGTAIFRKISIQK